MVSEELWGVWRLINDSVRLHLCGRLRFGRETGGESFEDTHVHVHGLAPMKTGAKLHLSLCGCVEEEAVEAASKFDEVN